MRVGKQYDASATLGDSETTRSTDGVDATRRAQRGPRAVDAASRDSKRRRRVMANAVVAIVAAGAGAFAGKLLDGKKRETSRGADDADDVDFKTDAKSNVDHAAAAKKHQYLAQKYPEVDERDLKTPDNWVKRHPCVRDARRRERGTTRTRRTTTARVTDGGLRRSW